MFSTAASVATCCAATAMELVCASPAVDPTTIVAASSADERVTQAETPSTEGRGRTCSTEMGASTRWSVAPGTTPSMAGRATTFYSAGTGWTRSTVAPAGTWATVAAARDPAPQGQIAARGPRTHTSV